MIALCALALLSTVSAPPSAAELEVFPKHFLLHPGEQIHYTVLERTKSSQRFADCEFVIVNPDIVRPIEPKGVLEAVRPGRTQLVVRTPTAERRFTIEVSGPARPPMLAIPHTALKNIGAKDFLFVGHANLDGFDHTAVAKPGIDGLVKEAKKNGWPVVYWVSKQYPDWYTDDRHPDYAIISEGQEHEIRVNAQRVVFAGGSFMFCLLRNAQMTLHGMVKHSVGPRITFVFPAKAIWVEDLWGPGAKRPYPAPMILLSVLFARRASDVEAYQNVVVPFLERMIGQFPVANYPPNPPTPPLTELLKNWNVIVRFGDRFERAYRRANSSKTLIVEFQGV